MDTVPVQLKAAKNFMSLVRDVDLSGTDYIAFEVNASGAIANVYNSECNGVVNDISKTSGTLNLGKDTCLVNATCNSKYFSTLKTGTIILNLITNYPLFYSEFQKILLKQT